MDRRPTTELLPLALLLCSCGSTSLEGTPDGASDVTYTDGPGDPTWDCPEEGTFRFNLEVECIGEEYCDLSSSPSSWTGTVLGLWEDSPGILAVGVEPDPGAEWRGARVYRVRLPDDGDIDLHAGETVDVVHDWNIGCIGCSWDVLTISRSGEPVLFARKVESHTYPFETTRLGPLTFSVIEGRCPTWNDPPGADCYEWERVGIEVGCDGPGEPVEIWSGGQALVPCGPGYHVGAGRLEQAIRYLPDVFCDLPDMYRDFVAIRHGDGLGR